MHRVLWIDDEQDAWLCVDTWARRFAWVLERVYSVDDAVERLRSPHELAPNRVLLDIYLPCHAPESLVLNEAAREHLKGAHTGLVLLHEFPQIVPYTVVFSYANEDLLRANGLGEVPFFPKLRAAELRRALRDKLDDRTTAGTL